MKTIFGIFVALMFIATPMLHAQQDMQSFVQPQGPAAVQTPMVQTPPVYPGQPVYPQPVYPQPVMPNQWNSPTINPNLNQNYNPYNPAVNGSSSINVQYDQWGNPIINTNQQTLFDSRLNPGANMALNGTMQNVNRWETDANGNRVHVTGQQWMGADGQWHGNLNRQTITNNGGVIQNNNEMQMFSTQGGNGG